MSRSRPNRASREIAQLPMPPAHRARNQRHLAVGISPGDRSPHPAHPSPLPSRGLRQLWTGPLHSSRGCQIIPRPPHIVPLRVLRQPGQSQCTPRSRLVPATHVTRGAAAVADASAAMRRRQEAPSRRGGQEVAAQSGMRPAAAQTADAPARGTAAAALRWT